MTVRPGLHNDVFLLSELGRATFRSTFAPYNTPENMEAYLAENLSEEKLAEEMLDPDSTFLIAELSGKPTGYAKLRIGPADPSVTGAKPIELMRLYVLSESIGHGIGARLMRECIDVATRRGYETLWLGVWEQNYRALAFYRKWGYEKVGSHIFQLGSDAQTDWILQKSLRI